MSELSYESYKARINAYGGNIQESTSRASKYSQEQQILHSPSLKYVKINDEVTLRPCIVSDVETFDIRKFLFIPETKILKGEYIHYENYVYLVTKHNTDDIYPEAIGELCNSLFTLTLEGQRVEVGRDDFNRPIYDFTDSTTYNIPCVLSTKIYSTVDNSPMPLPDGSIMIKIPYKIGQIPPINYTFDYRGNPYKVTTIEYDNVINEKGFIEMRLQRFTGGES